MFSLLLLPLLLMSSIQGQTCDMGRMEARMKEMVKEMKVEIKEEIKEEMEKKMRKKEKQLVDIAANMEENEATLRKESARMEDLGRAVGLRDLPYLTLCSFQSEWTTPESTITFDSFTTNFNNGERPGGADGQLDLGTGVFTCLSPGIYSITYSGIADLFAGKMVRIWLYLNGAKVKESQWLAYGSDTPELAVTGSRTLVS